jgi:pimeloyl-ACP methyl ester carboxylesterase
MDHGKPEKFTIAVPDEVLADLRERLVRTRFPGEVVNSGWTYGTNLAYLKELVEYWRTRYDWRAQERELNRFSHFKVGIGGARVHYIHAQGKGPSPKPLLLLHGWPGSIYEFMRIIPMLTDPAAHGGDARDAFTVVAPSLPGYGFSDDPGGGMDPKRISEILHALMTEVLGYQRFGTQGGDWGAMVASLIGHLFTSAVIGVHVNFVALAPSEGARASDLGDDEKKFLAALAAFRREEMGYFEIQGTKPQTIAYALNDSPAGLAAWIVEKFRTWSDCDGDMERRYTKDQLLTNVMIYWVTQSINSSMRLYYEQRHHPFRLPPGEKCQAPTAVALFPKELSRPPRRWAERVYNLKRFTEMRSGGHFAAMEEPAALAADIRVFFRDLS